MNGTCTFLVEFPPPGISYFLSLQNATYDIKLFWHDIGKWVTFLLIFLVVLGDGDSGLISVR